MSNQEAPKNIENEPTEEETDELTPQELDQMVGGDGTSNTFTRPPSLPPSTNVLIGL